MTQTLAQRIEAAFDHAHDARMDMLDNQRVVRNKEADAKLEHRDEWTSAKNNDVRAVLLNEWLVDDMEYWDKRTGYEAARDEYRLALLEIERLRLLVAEQASKGGAS